MINYGFSSTDEVQYDGKGLPVGHFLVMATGEEMNEKGTGIVVELEILQGEKKGKKGKIWYNTLHENPVVSNIAKQQLKRIADATGKPITPTSPIKGRVFQIIISENKKDSRYTEITKYLPETGDFPASGNALDAPF